MKKKPATPPPRETKSYAAEKLGGQPESDREAREAGVASATSPSESKKTKEKEN